MHGVVSGNRATGESSAARRQVGRLAGGRLSNTTRQDNVFAVITRTSTILLDGLMDLSDDASWREFDGRYRPLMMAVGRRLGLDAADTEDAAQETLAAFVVDYRAGRYKRDSGRLRDWLTGIMTHKVRDAQRRIHRQRPSARSDSLELIEDTSVRTAMEQEWARAVLRQCLEQVRQEVAPQMFESFELFALKQWPAAQVAERMGVSADVVYQHKRRVLVRIRELLSKIEETW
jgi:RNA polymerase sigma factor (sigma-70 family)